MPTARTAAIPAGTGFGATAAPTGTGHGTTAMPTGDPRDPWGASADPAHTHDPHEVTVQLDAVDLRQDMRLRQAAGAPPGGPDSSDRPVFVDESGRRSRRFRRLGMAIGLACAVYAVVIVVTLMSGSSDAPWLPVPGQNDDRPASKVDTSPAPTGSAGPSGAPDASPDVSPTATDGVIPPTAGSGTADGTTTAGTAVVPGASGGLEPTATRTTVTPGGGAGDPVPSQPVEEPTTTSPTPTATTSPDPSEPADSGGPVANGPSDPSPVAEGDGHRVLSLAAPPEPPEYTL
ncbi:hypothetical protein ACIQKE_38210 [Streptomyces griseoviridis]|uniref:hypothetical protein n=1 Tax=Streptomyces TaxID=1883 RepID=UPI002475E45A|nr:hypothetical protein [Streptomyces sp. MAA16]MDH6702124.1 hypothetical protein [Streptomyces sp. MAA16]